jgi:hypothetical protein
MSATHADPSEGFPPSSEGVAFAGERFPSAELVGMLGREYALRILRESDDPEAAAEPIFQRIQELSREPATTDEARRLLHDLSAALERDLDELVALPAISPVVHRTNAAYMAGHDVRAMLVDAREKPNVTSRIRRYLTMLIDTYDQKQTERRSGRNGRTRR